LPLRQLLGERRQRIPNRCTEPYSSRLALSVPNNGLI